MSPLIIVVIAIFLLGIVIVITIMIKYTTNQNIRCPDCQLEFVTELFMIQNNALLVCPFCRQWILATKSSDRYLTKKLFA